MMGSMLHKHEQTHVVKEWLAGLKIAQTRAIVSLSGLEDDQKALFKSDNDVFFVESFIPHHWLFPKLAGVVHHGGAGTTHTGLLYGLPTLILPFGADQPFNGDRIRINKLGPEPIAIRSVTASKFATAVKHLVHDQHMVANAKRVGGVLQQEDGVGTAANIVVDLLADKSVKAPVKIVMKQ
jgi:sterol 3beta-glucosyltransferase